MAGIAGIALTYALVARSWHDRQSVFSELPSCERSDGQLCSYGNALSVFFSFTLLHSMPNDIKKIRHERARAKYQIDLIESLYTSSTIGSLSGDTMLDRDVAPPFARVLGSRLGTIPSRSWINLFSSNV